MKVALAQINPTVGAVEENQRKILQALEHAQGADLVIFPEMVTCGYPPQDLLLQPHFVEALELPKFSGVSAVIGTVRQTEAGLCNSAAIFEKGKLLGYYDKQLLPNYDVFSENRYFKPGNTPAVWELCGKRVAITICEDIWQHAEDLGYGHDPIAQLGQVDLLVNLSASPYYHHRLGMRRMVCEQAAKTLGCPVFLCNQVGGNDRLIFDGYSLAVNEKGEVMGHAKGFDEDLVVIDSEGPPIEVRVHPTQDLFDALVLGVRDYFHKLGFSKACLGLSGGIDSALVAVIAVEALGKENVHALALPSVYSGEAGREDARLLAQELGIELQEVSIEGLRVAYGELFDAFLSKERMGIVDENVQARIRGTLLMAYSNATGALVLATGNKSEMAMGYSTLYGDMCGGLGVLADVSKMQVYALAQLLKNRIPKGILERPPSAELRAGQKDSDALPEYSILDAVLREYVEEHKTPVQIATELKLDPDLVHDLVRRIHQNEYKRQQAPPGLRVTKKAFTMGRRFPIVHQWSGQ